MKTLPSIRSARLKALLIRNVSQLHCEIAPSKMSAVKAGLASLAQTVAPAPPLDLVSKMWTDATTYRSFDAYDPFGSKH